ncbi:MAG: SGNH/GDSL hydrolase family protein [candidate division KSB1 bacterium]|nr:SGNH/GDSL hydrolase family protein [candidate division KSB1 bacterium]MDZ7300577.1 SGNH/GDSL hydrolase family protein [candidate division KSB1 bacterium]MDZ7309714.1 SGNH/GDSL hydrolase family protein [candidate division KSB1 bacterium]
MAKKAKHKPAHARPESTPSRPFTGRNVLSPAKRRLFQTFLVLTPLFLLGLAEIGLRVFGYGTDTRLFIPAPGRYDAFYRGNPDVGKRYFLKQPTIPKPQKDLFLRIKPENGIRIFALGGSTTAGFPFGNNLMFSRILEKRLADVFPDRRIEMVNLGMSAVCSYTLLDFMDEILAQKPDAILIYAGHNEFYGAMGVASMETIGKNRSFVRLYLRLEGLKLFMLVRDVIGEIRYVMTGKRIAEEDPGDVTLMERIVGNPNIPYGGPIYEKGKRQFKGNLIDILKKAKKAGVPVVLSELVSNIRDQSPLGAVDSDSLLFAERAYQEAQRLEALKRFDEAKIAYLRAKDFDPVRFRAPEEFNDIIHQVASQFDVPVVPMKQVFEEASPNGLIGNSLMIDHLHPNIDGYFLMADAYFQTLRTHHLLAATWDSTRIRPASYYRQNWGYTEIDSLYGKLSIQYLKNGWPFQPKTAPHLGLRAYRPASVAESLAVALVAGKGKVRIERWHLGKARWHEKRGELEKAFREYRALYHTIPYEIRFYQGAVLMLFAMKQPERAISVLSESLRYIDTPFANRWIGRLLLVQGKIRESIPYLEKAKSAAPSDPEILRDLRDAYNASRDPRHVVAPRGLTTADLLATMIPLSFFSSGRRPSPSALGPTDRMERTEEPILQELQ